MAEWETMASAPKNGTHILAWDGQTMAVVYWSVFNGRGEWDLVDSGAWSEDNEFYGVTHWMPLPEPPKYV